MADGISPCWSWQMVKPCAYSSCRTDVVELFKSVVDVVSPSAKMLGGYGIVYLYAIMHI